MVWYGVLYVSWSGHWAYGIRSWLGYVRLWPISLSENRFKCPGLVWPPLGLPTICNIYLSGLGIVQEIQGAGYPDESTETQILDLPPHLGRSQGRGPGCPSSSAVATPADTTSFLQLRETVRSHNTNIATQNTPTVSCSL